MTDPTKEPALPTLTAEQLDAVEKAVAPAFREIAEIVEDVDLGLNRLHNDLRQCLLGIRPRRLWLD